MKNGLNSRSVRLSLLLVILPLVLTGAFWDTPKLMNDDPPFVDLEGSIGTSIGNAEKAYKEVSALHSADQSQKNETSQNAQVSNPANVTAPSSSGKSDITIEVSGEMVKLGNDYYGNPDIFKNNVVEKGTLNGKKVKLTDDWAEAGTYKRVRSILDSAGIGYYEVSVD